MHALCGLQVVESVFVNRGDVVIFRERVLMHPLDVITATTPNLLRRLEASVAWHLDSAHRKLDRLSSSMREVATDA